MSHSIPRVHRKKPNVIKQINDGMQEFETLRTATQITRPKNEKKRLRDAHLAEAAANAPIAANTGRPIPMSQAMVYVEKKWWNKGCPVPTSGQIMTWKRELRKVNLEVSEAEAKRQEIIKTIFENAGARFVLEIDGVQLSLGVIKGKFYLRRLVSHDRRRRMS